MEDTKNMKLAIVDEHYIDHLLHQQGLGQEDEDEIRNTSGDNYKRARARRDITYATTQCGTC
eukprot:4405940-Amphidinium_carterae.1